MMLLDSSLLFGSPCTLAWYIGLYSSHYYDRVLVYVIQDLFCRNAAAMTEADTQTVSQSDTNFHT